MQVFSDDLPSSKCSVLNEIHMDSTLLELQDLVDTVKEVSYTSTPKEQTTTYNTYKRKQLNLHKTERLAGLKNCSVKWSCRDKLISRCGNL